MDYGTLALLFSLFFFHCTALSDDYVSPDSYDYSDDSFSAPVSQKPIVRNPSRVKINYHKTTFSPATSLTDNSFNQDTFNSLDNPNPLDMQSSPNMISPMHVSDKFHRIKDLPTSIPPDNSNNQDMPNLSDTPSPLDMQSPPNVISLKPASSNLNNFNGRSTLRPSGKSNTPGILNTEDFSVTGPNSETTTSNVSTRPVIIRSKVRRRRTTTLSPKDYSSTESISESDYPIVDNGQTSPATTAKPLPLAGPKRKLRFTVKPTSKTTISIETTTQTSNNSVEIFDSQLPNNSLNVETAPKIIPNKGVRFVNQRTTISRTTPALDPLNADYTENDISNNQSDMPPTTTAKTPFRSRLRPTTASKINNLKITTTKSTQTNKMIVTGEPINNEAQINDINPTSASQYNPTNMGPNSEDLVTKPSTAQASSKGKPTYMPPKARSKPSSSVSSSSTSKTLGRYNKKTTDVNSIHINPTASFPFEDSMNSSKMVSTHTYSHYTRKVASSMPSSTTSRTYSRYTRPTTTSKSTSKITNNTKYTRSFSSTISPDIIAPSMPVIDDFNDSPASIAPVDDYIMDSVLTTQTLKADGEIIDPASLPSSTDYDL